VWPSARWWSITAYANDFFLFPDPQHRYSLNGSTARLDAQGRFELHSGPTPPPAPAGPATGAPWLVGDEKRDLAVADAARRTLRCERTR
jgi:hypothetical protein